MSTSPKALSRRDLLKGGTAAAALIALPARAAAANCMVGFNAAAYTVQGYPVQTQANPGSLGSVAYEHMVQINYYKVDSYLMSGSGTETRNLLCVDVGANPNGGMFHPVEVGDFAHKNTISDIYVFNQTDSSLLFWRKLGSADTHATAMFTVPASLVASKPKITVVARCSAHGYWGADADLGVTPLNYSGAVPSVNTSLICGGATLWRPWVAPNANGFAGDLGVLHRPMIIPQDNQTVKVWLGGDATGAGKHPIFAENHYVMGGVLYDQDGNLIGSNHTIRYSEANDQQVVFTGLNLSGDKVKTLRAVMFDTLQGRLMSFLDL